MEVSTLREDTVRLRSQIVESPEELKNQMEKMRENQRLIKTSIVSRGWRWGGGACSRGTPFMSVVVVVVVVLLCCVPDGSLWAGLWEGTDALFGRGCGRGLTLSLGGVGAVM